MLNRHNKIALSDAGMTSAADVIAETLEFNHLNLHEFAHRIDVSVSLLDCILAHDAFISPEIAHNIEDVICIIRYVRYLFLPTTFKNE